MQKPVLDAEAVRAMETVFRSSHGREMSPEERRYFKLPEPRPHNGHDGHDRDLPVELGSKVERKTERGLIAWLITHPDKLLLRRLEALNFKVLKSQTTDKLVADCVNQAVDIVILDQHFFVETAGWSVAQSVKHIKPNAYVMLVSRRSWPHDRLPKGVDAVVPFGNSEQLLALLGQLPVASQFERST